MPAGSPWFRGQTESWPPTPTLFRHKVDEHLLVERFRSLAPMFGGTPPREEKDSWLYLMEHVGVPTRLLDWSEGALIGLYFAVQGVDLEAAEDENKTDPCVWILHPLELNKLVFGIHRFPQSDEAVFIERCDLAYGKDAAAGEPIAILPNHVHPRMKSQKGCFNLHGSDSRCFEKLPISRKLVKKGFFLKITVKRKSAPEILQELRWIGITHCSLFPDHDGLATELKRIFLDESSSRDLKGRLGQTESSK
ncbi:MAG: FRG domain-containing protein [Deltaproteobacteria bacterium]|nr:FRG domain-containing protein [Deltaproteobacteria bacterium]